MRKKQRRSSSDYHKNSDTYDILLLKGKNELRDINDLSGEFSEKQPVIASGISTTEVIHLKKILKKNDVEFKICRHKKKNGEKSITNLARGNIALFESLKDSGDYRINHIDCLCLASLAMLLILLVANAISATGKADTELHRTVISQDTHKVKRIVEKRPDFLSLRDEQGRIPLHYVGSCNMLEIPIIMLEHGSPVNIMDNYGRTPADYALKNNNRTVFYLMKKKGAISTQTE